MSGKNGIICLVQSCQCTRLPWPSPAIYRRSGWGNILALNATSNHDIQLHDSANWRQGCRLFLLKSGVCLSFPLCMWSSSQCQYHWHGAILLIGVLEIISTELTFSFIFSTLNFSWGTTLLGGKPFSSWVTNLEYLETWLFKNSGSKLSNLDYEN